MISIIGGRRLQSHWYNSYPSFLILFSYHEHCSPFSTSYVPLKAAGETYLCFYFPIDDLYCNSPEGGGQYEERPRTHLRLYVY